MEQLQLTDNFGRVIRSEWVEYGAPDPPWAVDARREIRADKKRRREYGNPYGTPMRRGEGWHKRGYRNSWNELAVAVACSPRSGNGSHTIEFRDHATAKNITASAIRCQVEDAIVVPDADTGVCVPKEGERGPDGATTATALAIQGGGTPCIN